MGLLFVNNAAQHQRRSRNLEMKRVMFTLFRVIMFLERALYGLQCLR